MTSYVIEGDDGSVFVFGRDPAVGLFCQVFGSVDPDTPVLDVAALSDGLTWAELVWIAAGRGIAECALRLVMAGYSLDELAQDNPYGGCDAGGK